MSEEMKMRKSTFALMFILIFSVPMMLTISMKPVYAGLDDDLVAYWTFDESRGNIAYDEKGDSHLSLTGASASYYKHISEENHNCIYFNNSEGLSWALSDYSSSDPLRITDDLTIQMWFKTDHELLRAGLFDYHSISGRADRVYLIYLIYNELKIRYVHQSVEGTTEFVTSDSNAWVPNVWQRITVVRDANEKTIDIYVNGECVGSDTYDYDPIEKDTAYLHIGTQVEFVGGIQNPIRFYAFDGYIDDAKIWDRTLSEREIFLSFHADKMMIKHGLASCDTSLGYGESGKSIDFDGDHDYIEVPNEISLNPRWGISVSVHVKCDDYKVGHNSAIVRKNGVFALALTTTGKVRFTVWIEGKITSATSSISIGNGSWTTIKGIYDGRNVKVFVEGVETGSTPARGEIDETTANLYIGAGNKNKWLSYDGKLDNISARAEPT
jgi:hypothetical protein